ncbi:hypothetical protein ES703_107807 [subsurface metagenome]
MAILVLIRAGARSLPSKMSSIKVERYDLAPVYHIL